MAANPWYPSRALFGVALASLWVVSLSFGLSSHAYAQKGESVPDEVLVSVQASSDDAAMPHQLGAVGKVVGHSNDLHYHRIKLPKGASVEGAIAALRGKPGVLDAEPNYLCFTSATPNDPSFTTQWAPKKVQADLAWGIWTPNAQVIVAIIDTGIDSTHPDLTNKILRDASGIVGYSAILRKRDNAIDDRGHGTHCAGIAAAQINNGVGIAGIAGWNGQAGSTDTTVKLMPVKALTSTGVGSHADIADGITWAANNGARVISLSLGGPNSSTVLANAIAYAWTKGCVVVAAAGNNSTSVVQYPAGYPHVISVAATDSTDTLSSFSSFGSWVSVAAPGSAIYSTLPTYATSGNFGLNYGSMSGTSMATPHVAGEAALLLSFNPGLTNAQVSSYITTNVDPYNPYLSNSLGPGVGRINVYRALQAAGGTVSQPPPSTSLSSLTLKTPSIVGGYTFPGTVTLSSAAPTGGVSVALSSNVPSAASVPATITVPAGATSATFNVTTYPVNAITNTTLTATYNGVSKTAALQVYTPLLNSLTLSSSSVTGGTSVTATVTLVGTAASNGCIVTLSSNNAKAVVPASVKVAAGSKTATFTITTSAVSANTSVTISGTFNGTKTATLTLTP